MTHHKINFITVALGLMLIASCSNDETDKIVPDEMNSQLPFQELYDQGIDRYLGTIDPIETLTQPNGLTEYIFTSEDGPVCFTGNQFSMFTRNGSGNNLLIFLQGGGLCSPFGCSDPVLDEGIPLIPLGILSPTDSSNPTQNYDLGYLPYCDASLWTGDSEVDSDGDGEIDRFHKGLINLSASLDIVLEAFPAPDKIVLAGNSAGGSGVHAALPLVRKLYPDVKIQVINDSGLGISREGFWEASYAYWNSTSLIPSSCADCLNGENLIDYFSYQLRQDENIELAFISSKQDFMTSGGIGGEAFETQLLEMATELNEIYPERCKSLIANGNDHTFIVSDFNYQIGDWTVKEWVSAMITESEDWVTFIE